MGVNTIQIEHFTLGGLGKWFFCFFVFLNHKQLSLCLMTFHTFKKYAESTKNSI